MAAPGKLSIGKIISRYAAVVLFPTVSVSLIFLDWNHTRKWKIAEREKQAALNSELQ